MLRYVLSCNQDVRLKKCAAANSNYYEKQIPHYGIVAYDSYVDHHVENFAVEL